MQSRGFLLPIGPSTAYIPLTRGHFARVDSDNAVRIGTNNWQARWDPTGEHWYASRSINLGGGRWRIDGMHRVIQGPSEGSTVDHINRQETLNNQRYNLREANPTMQTFNQGLRSDNTSGHRGVSWREPDQKWLAVIRVHGRDMRLGLHATMDQAIAARLAGEAKYRPQLESLAR